MGGLKGVFRKIATAVNEEERRISDCEKIFKEIGNAYEYFAGFMQEKNKCQLAYEQESINLPIDDSVNNINREINSLLSQVSEKIEKGKESFSDAERDNAIENTETRKDKLQDAKRIIVPLSTEIPDKLKRIGELLNQLKDAKEKLLQAELVKKQERIDESKRILTEASDGVQAELSIRTEVAKRVDAIEKARIVAAEEAKSAANTGGASGAPMTLVFNGSSDNNGSGRQNSEFVFVDDTKLTTQSVEQGSLAPGAQNGAGSSTLHLVLKAARSTFPPTPK